MEAGKTEEMQPPRDLRPPPLASVLLASILHFHLSPSLYIFLPPTAATASPLLSPSSPQTENRPVYQRRVKRSLPGGLQMSCQVQGPDHKGNKRSPPHRRRKKKEKHIMKGPGHQQNVFNSPPY